MTTNSLATGLRVLCLDGGGIRGLSEILILKELMLQVRLQSQLVFAPEPWQCFDLICGTSTGGLLAVLLGRLGKSLDDCERIFRSLGNKIFSEGSASRKARLVFKGSRHASDGLREILDQQAGNQIMYESGAVPGHVPTAVVAVAKTTGKSSLFRTYGVRAQQEQCRVIDSCLATSAATTFFEEVNIRGITYVDGAFGNNNPSGITLKELEQIDWLRPMGDAVAEIACLVSIGTGRLTYSRPRDGLLAKFIPAGIKSAEEAIAICLRLTMSCYEEHLEIKQRFAKAGRTGNYFRFDVDRGLEAVELNESDDKSLQHITATTDAYLKESAGELAVCAGKINPRTRGNATRVYFQSFDIDAEDLTAEEFTRVYRDVGFQGQHGEWTGRISDGVFTLIGSKKAHGQPLVNSFNYSADIDGHAVDLRDSIFAAAVQLAGPALPDCGAGILVRHIDSDDDTENRGLVFLKEASHCCSIFYLRGGSLFRKASFPLPMSGSHNSDSFDKLKVIASGNRVTFMVNDQVVAEKDDQGGSGFRRVAIIAVGEGTYRFDNLELWLQVTA